MTSKILVGRVIWHRVWHEHVSFAQWECLGSSVLSEPSLSAYDQAAGRFQEDLLNLLTISHGKAVIRRTSMVPWSIARSVELCFPPLPLPAEGPVSKDANQIEPATWMRLKVGWWHVPLQYTAKKYQTVVFVGRNDEIVINEYSNTYIYI